MAPTWSRCLINFYKLIGIIAAFEQHCEATDGEEGGITKALGEDVAAGPLSLRKPTEAGGSRNSTTYPKNTPGPLEADSCMLPAQGVEY